MNKPTIPARCNAVFGGLLVTALSLIFVVVGIVFVVQSANRAATYLPATATVDKITGGNDASDRLTLAYSFSVNGKRYNGEESANDEERTHINELRQYKVGQQLTIYYDPSDPAQSQRSVKAQAFGLVFVILVLPFLAIGLNQLWQGLTGKEMIRSRQPNAQSDAVPGGGLFWVFVMSCVAGAVGQVALSSKLDWPSSLVGGLIILFVAIPAVNLWANRRIKQWRYAKSVRLRKAHAARTGSDTDASEDSDGETCQKTLDGLGKKMALALAVTIFWCGITGLFACFTVGSMVKHHYAAAQFSSTEGVVISSKVKTSSGSDDECCFAPKIKYRYNVAGQNHVGEHYDFSEISSNDSSYARRIVSENPPGRTVTVYYNPSDPSEAILSLEPPPLSYFLLLFLQPFLLVGLMMIGWCVMLPADHGQLKQFFRCDASLPWRIPGWGIMQQNFDGLVIQGRRSLLAPLGYLLAGYGLTCFFSIFVVAIFSFQGFGNFNVNIIRAAFAVAACVGIAALLWSLFGSGGSSRVVIDQMGKCLAVHSRRRDREVPLAQIKGLGLRRIPYRGRMVVNGNRVRFLLLEAEVQAGQPLPLHAFKWQAGQQDEVSAIARRVQRLLAGVIGCPVVKRIADDEPEQSGWPSSSAAAVGQIANLIRGRDDNYSDLAS